MKALRIIRLQQHEGAVISQRLHNRLISVTFQDNQTPPPLMFRFVRDYPNLKLGLGWFQTKLRFLVIGQKRKAGEEYQRGPTLVSYSRLLGNRKRAVWIRSKPLTKKLDRASRNITYSLRIPCWRRRWRRDW